MTLNSTYLTSITKNIRVLNWMITSIILLLISLPTYSQNLEDSLVHKSCDCISRISFNEKKFNRDSLTKAMNRCFSLKEIKTLYRKITLSKEEEFKNTPNQEQEMFDYGYKLNNRLKDCPKFKKLIGRISYKKNPPINLEEEQSCKKNLNGFYKSEEALSWISDSFYLELDDEGKHAVFFKLKKQEECYLFGDFFKSYSSSTNFEQGDRIQIYVTKATPSSIKMECWYKGNAHYFSYARIKTQDSINLFVDILIASDEISIAKSIANTLLKNDSLNPEFQFLNLKVDYTIDPNSINKNLSPIINTPKNLLKVGERISIFLARKGKSQEALQVIEKLISISPQKLNFIISKAQLLTYMGKYSESEKLTSSILIKSPKNIDALVQQAINYKHLKKRQQLIQICNKILSIDPENFIPLDLIAYNYLENGKYKTAINYLNRILQLEINDETKGRAFNNRGFAKYKLGKYDDAISDIKESLFYFPKNSYTFKNLALIQIATNKLGVACVNLNKALDFGFAKLYGDEVENLIQQNCNK